MKCAHCGTEVPWPHGSGQKYCGTRCRSAARYTPAPKEQPVNPRQGIIGDMIAAGAKALVIDTADITRTRVVADIESTDHG